MNFSAPSRVADESVIGEIAKRSLRQFTFLVAFNLPTKQRSLLSAPALELPSFLKMVCQAALISNANKAMYRSKGGLSRFAFAESWPCSCRHSSLVTLRVRAPG